MPLENSIITGDCDTVRSELQELSPQQLESLFLLSVAFEQEDIASLFLENRADDLSSRIINEAFRSAAAHNEIRLIERIYDYCGKSISQDTLLEALQMSVAKGYKNLIDALNNKDRRVAKVINTEDPDHPHLLMLATELGDSLLIERLLKLPGIRILHHHIEHAKRRGKLRIAEILKLHRIRSENRGLVQYLNLWEHERDNCPIGPHLRAEIIKRDREILRNSRSREM